MSQRQVKLTFAYDGTDFHGFQAQKSAARPLRTIQGELENVLRAIIGDSVSITGAGRTDAGVHAKAQVATFTDDGTIPIERWVYLLNHRLPPDIIALSAEVVPDTFHPRFDAKRKLYRYTLETARIPNIFNRRFCTHLGRPLDVKKMEEAGRHLVGTHDFTTFSATHAQVSNRVRTLFDVRVTREGTLIHLWYEGNGFLQYMVRILSGTLVDVGLGKTNPDDIPRFIEAKDRKVAGKTMPPEGLTLWKVIY